jgi:hypothetical protein
MEEKKIGGIDVLNKPFIDKLLEIFLSIVIVLIIFAIIHGGI